MRLLLFLLFFSLFQSTCLDRSNQAEVKMGQSVRTDLIVIFKPNVSLEDRARFNEETIGRRIPGRDGVSFVKGIEASLALPDLCSNQHGLALKLRADVSDEQYHRIRNAIRSSPIVERIETDVEPAKVRCAR
jgi:hypothetical protein